jgi:hypothetical protein
MLQDRLTKTVLRRFEELGLPPSLIEFDQFRDHLFHDGWVMFVRDHDKIANVHLIQPRKSCEPAIRMPQPGKTRRG